MPTYDHLCPNGHRFEVFGRMSDDPVVDCPECGEPAERLISGGAGLLFKGGRGPGTGPGTGSGSSGKTLDGGSSSGEPPHAPRDLTIRD